MPPKDTHRKGLLNRFRRGRNGQVRVFREKSVLWGINGNVSFPDINILIQSFTMYFISLHNYCFKPQSFAIVSCSAINNWSIHLDPDEEARTQGQGGVQRPLAVLNETSWVPKEAQIHRDSWKLAPLDWPPITSTTQQSFFFFWKRQVPFL